MKDTAKLDALFNASTPAEMMVQRPSAALITQLGRYERTHALRKLSLSVAKEAGLRALAAGKAFSGLLDLTVAQTRISASGLSALASSPTLQNLERLELDWSGIDLQGLCELLKPGAFPRLRSLRLTNGPIFEGEGFDLLLDSELATQLIELDLMGSQLQDHHVASMAASPALSQLQTLSLKANPLGPRAAEAIATSQCLTQLKSLDIGHNHQMNAEGMQWIASSKNFDGLTHLGLRASLGAKKEENIEQLLALRNLASIESLDLSGNTLESPSVSLLANGAKAFPALSCLNLEWNFIDAACAGALAASPLLSSLEELILTPVLTNQTLGIAGIGDEGASALAASAQLQRIKRLDLSNNAIGDRGAQALASSELLKGVEWLKLNHNKISPVGLEPVVASFGARVDVSYQRNMTPSPEVSTAPAKATGAVRKQKKVSREKSLKGLKARPFRHWRDYHSKETVVAAEEIAADALAALVALGPDAQRTDERKILRRYLARFDALDKRERFIDTTDAEDIYERFEELRENTSLADDDTLFDKWRSF